MAFLAPLIAIAVLLIAKWSRAKKFPFTILFLFYLYWCVIMIISYLKPYGEYYVSNEAYSILLIFIACFGLGFVLRGNRGKVKDSSIVNHVDIQTQYDQYIGKNRKLLIISIITLIILCYYALRYGSIMTIDTYQNARLERFYVGTLFQSTLELLFYNYIITMFKYLFAFIIAFSLMYKRLTQVVFWVSTVGLVLYAYIGSSRFPFVLLLFNIAILYCYKRSQIANKCKKPVSIKSIAVIIVIIVAVILVMSYLTAFRRGAVEFSWASVIDNMDILWEQIIDYNIGPISGFSYLLDSGYMYNHYYCGLVVVFNGFTELIFNFLNMIGISAESPKTVLAEIANVEQVVGAKTFNALYTCVYWMYSDSGLAGTAVFSMLFGMLSRYVIDTAENAPTIFAVMLSTHFCYFILASTMIWQINNVDSLIYIVILIIALRKNKCIELSYENGLKSCV